MPDRDGDCPLEELISRIGGKWKVIILWQLLDGPRRFGELRRQMPTATPKTLTAQLRELESDGFLTRRVFAQVPPKVEYSATPLSASLRPVLRAMHDWSAAHLMSAKRKLKRAAGRRKAKE